VVVAAVLALGAGACSSGGHSGSSATSRSSAAPASTRPVASSSVSAAPSSPAPTTIGPAAGVPFFPVSATFVSARQGWALEGQTSECLTDICNFRVVATADGGRTWQTLAGSDSLLRYGPGPEIRFADTTHGFVFDSTHIFATRDGGAHWTLLHIPFETVQALEIVRGEVYVVAASLAQGDQAFRIWSTPADSLHWTRHALTVPLGAGPVPEQQLVLTGGTGWMINNDRTVISGARRSGAGDWTQWTPPCLDVMGPATLSASSPNDLVALCDEHVWGGEGPITAAVYFSHDAGATFRRRTAPAYGSFSSPNRSSAVIVDGRTIWRTTDEGSTWNVVGRPGGVSGDSAVEIGFTTPTQGYLIEGRGGMFITRDAGASWTRAPLP
jgi:photosystem II stability/assembly factor-like uncharacterized protein